MDGKCSTNVIDDKYVYFGNNIAREQNTMAL
jgi:hypothetical protein